jgi:type I restriction enzyme M protein
MEACIIVCRSKKPAARRQKVLFIDAVREVARERAQSFLAPAHQERILRAYRAFTDEPGFAKVATNQEILARDANLSIVRYVRPTFVASARNDGDLASEWLEFETSGRMFWEQIEALVESVESELAERTPDA